MGNLTVREKHLAKVHSKLGGLLESKMDALPSDFNQTRFLQNCMTVLQDTKEIEKMEPNSVARTMLKGAFLGLDFFTKECYAISYWNKDKNCKELQFQTDYKGEVKLAKKYSINPILDIYAKVVRDGDEFEEEVVNGKPSVNFRPKPFNDGDIVGVFAVVLYKDGSMIYDTMSRAQIEDTRQNFSKTKDGPAWKKSYGEMCKKTVLRRLCKLVELDFDNQEQIIAFENGGDADFTQTAKSSKPKATSVLDTPIDVEATEVKEPVEEAQTTIEDIAGDNDLPFNN